MDDSFEKILKIVDEVHVFLTEFGGYLIKKLHISYITFEVGKGIFVTALYRQRGRLARSLMHSGMATLAAVGIAIAPIVTQEFPGRNIDPWGIPTTSEVLSATTENPDTETFFTEARDKIVNYVVVEGDTLSSIAEKFGVSSDTVRWQNNIGTKDQIKVGQTLDILPVTGVSHKVQKGDTVYTISKKYDADSQAIADFPFNVWKNDETLELAIGQIIIVPDGVRPAERPTAPRIRQTTPDAGTVVASGQFVWPTSGSITQRFVWYHKGLDIANRASPGVLAADAGRVITAGWPDGNGYGNRVVIDHGNGYKTLYAHLSKVHVTQGQTVKRGDAIGQMGTTGRSTGIHLHFEVIQNGVYINPLSVLK